jgi:type IV pilus assembly protein PilB
MVQGLKTQEFENFLVDHGFVTQAIYDSAKKQAATNGGSVLDLLVAQKIITTEALAQANAAFLNIPFISFTDKKVDAEVLDIIPEDTVHFYRFFAFERESQNIKVAVVDPTNLQALEALEFFAKKMGYSVKIYVTDETSFSKITNKQQNIKKVVGEALANIEQQKKEEEDKNKVADEQARSALQQNIEDAPISKIVDVILSNAINGRASDIHIEPTEKEVRVRYRLDGILHVSLVLPKTVQNAVVSKIKILSNLKIDESRLPQDGRFHYETESRAVDLRVSVLPNINGEKIVMRILDKTTKVPTLEDLGFRGKALEWTNENIKKTHGIFLITGPTGSGKSTTLYSVLSLLNDPKVNIVTLEDPVEYFMEGVNQTQVNSEIGFTFATGLRSILRQDPNVVMVGEIRDKETAELAVQAALTGHLVFSTLHTNNSVGALPRLMDMGIEPFLLIASINAVGAQRLTRKICADCKKQIEMPEMIHKEVLEVLQGVSETELEGVDLKNLTFYKGEGCEKCGHTGYKGRVAIVELLPVIPKIQNLVLNHSSPADIYTESLKMGMITMRQDGVLKVLKGLTTYEEVARVTSE